MNNTDKNVCEMALMSPGFIFLPNAVALAAAASFFAALNALSHSQLGVTQWLPCTACLQMLPQLDRPCVVAPPAPTFPPSARLWPDAAVTRRWSFLCFSRDSPLVFGGLGDLLMPVVTPQSTGGSTAGSTGTPSAPGGISALPPATPPPTKAIGGDLDSSLANLVGGRQQLLTHRKWFFFKKKLQVL